MALQFTATMRPPPRWLLACRAWAVSSLPVPDSPHTSTGAMLRATLRMRSRTCCMAGDSPTSRHSAASDEDDAGAPAARPAPADTAGATPFAAFCAPCTAEAMTWRNWRRSTGLVR